MCVCVCVCVRARALARTLARVCGMCQFVEEEIVLCVGEHEYG